MRSSRTVIGAAIAWAAVLSANDGQDIAPQQPSFRTATTIVEVDVAVDDHDGRFPTDLGPSDFTILEDGRPQTIETMYVVRRPGPPRGAHR